jgi:IS30 family transposase
LTYEQRYHIYLLNKQGYNQTFIAKSMGRNKSTISRELSRNTGKRGYRHKQANRLADERHQKKNKAINASASINNTGALINVNAIRYPTLIIIFAIAFSILQIQKT